METFVSVGWVNENKKRKVAILSFGGGLMIECGGSEKMGSAKK